jgi:solute carrier family 25 (mitochondrial thiamine pyrophosphate transporter), member 19
MRMGYHPDQPPASFLCGAGAAAVATTVTYPLDLLRTLMAAQGVPPAYPTMGAAVRGTLATRGPAGLVAGLGVTLAEIIPYAGLQFGTYAALKQAVAHARAKRQAGRVPSNSDGSSAEGLTSWEKFMCGVLAGSASKLALHPADVVKKRLQVMGLRRHASYGASLALGSYTGAMQCLGAIARTEGIHGLYKGVVPNILKAAPASGITFVVYEGLLTAYKATRAAHEEQEAALRQRPL